VNRLPKLVENPAERLARLHGNNLNAIQYVVQRAQFEAQIQNVQLPEDAGFCPQRAAGEQEQPEQNPMQELGELLAQVSIEEDRVEGIFAISHLVILQLRLFLLVVTSFANISRYG
jgi:hypothetical protein